jgi:hypothetical protein
LTRPQTWHPWGISLAVIALAAGGIAIPPLLEWRQLTRLALSGETVAAKVTSSRIDATGRFASDVIHFEFQPKNSPALQPGTERFSRQSSTNLNDVARQFYAEKLAVRYLPSNPAIHRLDVNFPERIRRNRNEGLLFLGVSVGLAITAGILLIRLRYK